MIFESIMKIKAGSEIEREHENLIVKLIGYDTR